MLLFGEGALGRGLLAGEGREDLWGKGMHFLPDRDIERWGLEQAMKEAACESAGKAAASDDCRMGGRLNYLQPLLFWLHYLLGRNVPFRGLGFSHIGKGRLGTSSVSLAFVSTGGDLWDYLGSPCRWAAGREHRLHLAAFFLLLLFTAAGALLEGIFHYP